MLVKWAILLTVFGSVTWVKCVLLCVCSASVQQTLYDMGVGVLAKAPTVDKIHLYMVRHNMTTTSHLAT